MFTEILKIIPKLDASALNTMERTLGSRFKKVAKGFGKGIVGALAGGGLAGAALGLLDKLLNPLKETQEAIERTLSQADDVVTNAEQFQTTPGKLFKLQKFAQAKGLDADALNQLLVKFQGAVAEAQADPKKDTAVREFANDTDMAEAFFQFMQNLNKMDRKDQVVVQQEVFGEKQTLKMADFLRSDFAELSKKLGVGDASKFDPGLNKLAGLNDQADEAKARLSIKDTMDKSRIITSGMVSDRAKADALAAQQENERIANFHNLQTISDTSNKIMKLVEEGVFKVGELITKVLPAVNGIAEKIESFSKSGLRGLLGTFTSKDK